uniref:Ubiquitin-conjugating enzyme E2 U n=1 Tax=Equus asinus TaxID=9793 RepID=A0A9L0I5U7_EQUAS|nr:ubiquitin-conjugating enzyme E2 U isoform X3 [Equus asinus]
MSVAWVWRVTPKPQTPASESPRGAWGQILCCLIMHCRAYFLLEKDFLELKENNYPGIAAFPVSEDLLEWEAEIEGLQNTIWHGLPFQLTINFTPEYNFVPPTVKFRTIPFHPNVDLYTGRPCIDFLDNPDKWSTSYTLSSILLTLQVMLSNPVLENPVNLEAAQILIKNEHMYSLIVLRLFDQPVQYLLPVAPSAHPPSVWTGVLSWYPGEPPACLWAWSSCSLPRLPLGWFAPSFGWSTSRSFLVVKDDYPELRKDPDKFIRSIKVVSFDDYYKTWSGIATSKPTDYYRTPLFEDQNFIAKYYKWKKMELKHPKEWSLKYAAARARLARENRGPYRANYPTQRSHLCPTPVQLLPDSQTETDSLTKSDETEEGWKNEALLDANNTNESWEDEVEDLVAWTNTLDANALEDSA